VVVFMAAGVVVALLKLVPVCAAAAVVLFTVRLAGLGGLLALALVLCLAVVRLLMPAGRVGGIMAAPGSLAPVCAAGG
jgi:hypothetical protein